LYRWSDLVRTLDLALEAARELGDRAAEAWILNEQGSLAAIAGDPSARGLLGEALRLRGAAGDREGVELTTHNLRAAGFKPGGLTDLPARLKATAAAHSTAVAAGAIGVAAVTATGFAVADGWYGIGGGDRDFGPPGAVEIRPFDAPAFKVRAAGEFILAKSTRGDLEVQQRIQRAKASNAGIITAAAASVNGTNVVIDMSMRPSLRVDGRVVRGAVVRLAGGGTLRRSGGFYEIAWPDESTLQLSLDPAAGSLSADLSVTNRRKGQMTGLLGNFDGDASNDVMTTDGHVFRDPKRADYQEYLESWRVPDEDSLFGS
jgi:hypothetical protein